MRAGHQALTRVVAALAIGGLSACAPQAADEVSSAGSCAGPQVNLTSDSVLPGDELEIAGQAFVDGCGDSQTVEGGTPTPVEPSVPMQGLEVVWMQSGLTTRLATVDADDDGRWSVTVTVPSEAHGGPAGIRVEPAQNVWISVATQPRTGDAWPS